MSECRGVKNCTKMGSYSNFVLVDEGVFFSALTCSIWSFGKSYLDKELKGTKGIDVEGVKKSELRIRVNNNLLHGVDLQFRY